VGYSDHTPGINISVAAVALGARIIEKHFTLDRTMVGPDHRASIEPDQLQALVTGIREVEQALGSTEKVRSVSEAKNLSVARRSIVAATPIEKGEILNSSNICCKRPGTGISAIHWDEMIGSRASRDFLVDEGIE
ncbi:MAG: N-acetylneuraminate synthase, partial [Proteobacteria bacterium]|nr:N-acetylneuraminate synthase [Pseudomonadota bacterium]